MVTSSAWLQHVQGTLICYAGGGVIENGGWAFSLIEVNFMSREEKEASLQKIQFFKELVSDLITSQYDEPVKLKCLTILDTILKADDAIRDRTCKFIDSLLADAYAVNDYLFQLAKHE